MHAALLRCPWERVMTVPLVLEGSKKSLVSEANPQPVE